MRASDPTVLPEPDAAARAHSERVAAHVRDAITHAGGWLSFERYMHEVLYAPGLGYYVAGARKLGAAGDFVTAPEMTPLFGAALAAPVAAMLDGSAAREIVELGAGSGALAASLVPALVAAGVAVARYRIVEVSPDLRARQQAALAALPVPVEWCDALPERLDGAVILNEVLDAVPAHLVTRRDGAWLERGVRVSEGRFAFEDRPLAPGPLRDLAAARFPPDIDYASELNPAAEALVATLAHRLAGGGIAILDYGFPQAEYYHPQRRDGTLVGHYRHRVHADPFLWPGLSDLTAHVDFTAMATAGHEAGLAVAGYASQAGFLAAAGILDRLTAVGPPESPAYIRAAAAVQRLLSPAEMGELFKVLVLARDDGIVWRYFAGHDRSHRL